MRAGKKRHRITIQEPVSGSVGTYGGRADTWQEYAKVWANFVPLRGRDIITQQAGHNEITARFFIRYIPGITSKMRISFNSEYYDIVSVIDINGRGREIEILAKTGSSEG